MVEGAREEVGALIGAVLIHVQAHDRLRMRAHRLQQTAAR